jgi:hypothetical protein
MWLHPTLVLTEHSSLGFTAPISVHALRVMLRNSFTSYSGYAKQHLYSLYLYSCRGKEWAGNTANKYAITSAWGSAQEHLYTLHFRGSS